MAACFHLVAHTIWGRGRSLLFPLPFGKKERDELPRLQGGLPQALLTPSKAERERERERDAPLFMGEGFDNSRLTSLMSSCPQPYRLWTQAGASRVCILSPTESRASLLGLRGSTVEAFAFTEAKDEVAEEGGRPAGRRMKGRGGEEGWRRASALQTFAEVL